MTGVDAVVSAAALLSAVVVFATTGRGWTALRILLDLLTAAGLLRLAGTRSWPDLATAAVIVLLRALLWAVLSHGHGGGRPPPGEESAPRCGEDDHRIPLASRGGTPAGGSLHEQA